MFRSPSFQSIVLRLWIILSRSSFVIGTDSLSQCRSNVTCCSHLSVRFTSEMSHYIFVSSHALSYPSLAVFERSNVTRNTHRAFSCRNYVSTQEYPVQSSFQGLENRYAKINARTQLRPLHTSMCRINLRTVSRERRDAFDRYANEGVEIWS